MDTDEAEGAADSGQPLGVSPRSAQPARKALVQKDPGQDRDQDRPVLMNIAAVSTRMQPERLRRGSEPCRAPAVSR
jgi:hypothetical protein